MSYSFSIKAANKDEAVALVAAELDKVVAQQPIHEADRKAAQNTALNYIMMLRDDDALDVAVSVHGSLFVPVSGVQTASVNVTANLVARA